MATDKSYRKLLPKDVVPETYDLTLEPDLERFTFDGVVKITCDVQVATDVVQLHARDLLIKSAKFVSKAEGSTPMSASQIAFKMKDHEVAITFEEILPTGQGELEIVFQGTLNDQMAGFYRSKYKDTKGVEHHMATTQFEAIDARRCFPCWDEPGVKAVFVVTLIYPASLMALSNMPQSRSETIADGKRKEVFMPTPKMSTYLLAFCIGNFEYISGQTKDGTICRILCCPGKISKMSYALTCTIKSLEFYNEFFGVPYPLPKVDMIAIPDFSAGAMENWGLVTYREVALLCDEATVSAVQKQRICTVITHELAHQWFGNLVTMAWWDDLWLNEGFANWSQTFAADSLHPEWNIWESYVGSEQQQALKLDSLRSSHPIQVPIGRAEEVEEVFDAISYCKGGSIVRMIFAVLGEETFQKGLRLYFDRHKYGNTETSDLWKAWQEASGKSDFADMMNTWLSKMGFPVLQLTTDPFGGDASKQVCKQSWFLADGSSQPGDDEKTWQIPVIIGSDKGKTMQMMSGKEATLDFSSVVTGASWVKLNFGQHVPMRVLYPASMIERLVANMHSVPAEDRISLLSDSYALCKAGMEKPDQLVKLISGFKGEKNDKVWGELSTCLGGLDAIFSQCLDGPALQSWKRFAEQVALPTFLELGWDTRPGDDDNTKKLRTTMANLVASYSSPTADHMKVAVQKCNVFLQAVADGTDINIAVSTDVRTAVLMCAMKAEPSTELFDKLVAAHNKADDGAVRQSIYAALGNSPTKALREKALAWGIGGDVRSQDVIYLPMHVRSSGTDGAEECFQWIQREYDQIWRIIGETSMMLFGHVVRISGAGFATEEKASEVQKFWEGKSVHSKVAKTLQQVIEGIKTNALFASRVKASQLADPKFWEELASQ